MRGCIKEGCARSARPHSNYCRPCWDGFTLHHLRNKPLGERAFFLGVVVGMIKDAGYESPRDFFKELKIAWPHVKEPV